MALRQPGDQAVGAALADQALEAAPDGAHLRRPVQTEQPAEVDRVDAGKPAATCNSPVAARAGRMTSPGQGQRPSLGDVRRRLGESAGPGRLALLG